MRVGNEVESGTEPTPTSFERPQLSELSDSVLDHRPNVLSMRDVSGRNANAAVTPLRTPPTRD